jgi:hypothetical protein
MSELVEYQCHKKVWAKPMTLGDFKKHSHKVDLMGVDDKPGYLVVYGKDTDQEYHSWSPKDVFEEGYSALN